MNTLEKILEEVEDCAIEFELFGMYDEYVSVGWIKEIIRSCMNEVAGTNISVNSDSIDRKNLKEEIESLRIKIIGMRSGKTMAAQALEEYKKSILRIIDEQPTVHANDNWIPVSERLPEVPEGTEDVYCPEFNVTIKGASKATTLKYAPDGTWFDDSGEVYNVIAWQLLPEPYKGGDEK